ncbi:MAG: YqaA family protein, partial [Acidobacteriota bacterium]
KRSWRYGTICSLGSVLGGVMGYLIGWLFWEEVSGLFFTYVFSRQLFEQVAAQYDAYAFWAIFTAGFTPIPYKVFTISAGVFGISFPIFLAASVVARSSRFFLVAALVRRFGPAARVFIEKNFGWLSIVFVILLVGSFMLLKLIL